MYPFCVLSFWTFAWPHLSTGDWSCIICWTIPGPNQAQSETILIGFKIKTLKRCCMDNIRLYAEQSQWLYPWKVTELLWWPVPVNKGSYSTSWDWGISPLPVSLPLAAGKEEAIAFVINRFLNTHTDTTGVVRTNCINLKLVRFLVEIESMFPQWKGSLFTKQSHCGSVTPPGFSSGSASHSDSVCYTALAPAWHILDEL